MFVQPVQGEIVYYLLMTSQPLVERGRTTGMIRRPIQEITSESKGGSRPHGDLSTLAFRIYIWPPRYNLQLKYILFVIHQSTSSVPTLRRFMGLADYPKSRYRPEEFSPQGTTILVHYCSTTCTGCCLKWDELQRTGRWPLPQANPCTWYMIVPIFLGL